MRLFEFGIIGLLFFALSSASDTSTSPNNDEPIEVHWYADSRLEHHILMLPGLYEGDIPPDMWLPRCRVRVGRESGANRGAQWSVELSESRWLHSLWSNEIRQGGTVNLHKWYSTHSWSQSAWQRGPGNYTISFFYVFEWNIASYDHLKLYVDVDDKGNLQDVSVRRETLSFWCGWTRWFSHFQLCSATTVVVGHCQNLIRIPE